MFVATMIVSSLLAALIAFSAIRKLSHDDSVVRSYERAGVPEDKLNLLAGVLLAAAAALVAGLIWAPLGIAASGGLVAYFLGAISFHVRAGDTASLPTPLAMETLALAALALRSATL